MQERAPLVDAKRVVRADEELDDTVEIPFRFGEPRLEESLPAGTLSFDELQSMHMTQEMAQRWADFYTNETLLNPKNGSARGRARLMQYAADLLGGRA